MGLRVRLVGQAAKRGIIPRLPSADRLAAEIEPWLAREYADSLRSSRRRSAAEGAVELEVDLHPAGQPLSLRLDDTGLVVASAVTSAVGPGYHTFVCRLLERLGQELAIGWAPIGPDGSSDDAGFFGTGKRAAVERTFLTWLLASLVSARDLAARGRTGLHLATAPGVRFSVDGVLATWLGPRDEAWLHAAIRDPRVAIDVWPWWADAMDARCIVNRALCLMWTEVRWRPAATAEEHALVDEVLGLLQRAYPLDTRLAFPWPEWHELNRLRGGSIRLADVVAERARTQPATDRRIGYRREPVTIVHEGWQLEIPGTYAERRTDEEWWGSEGGRSITLAAVETASGGRPMTAEAFLAQVAGELGSDALSHRDGPILGRAGLTTEPRAGVALGVLEAYSAVTGSGAALRVEFDEPEDWQWALDQWRALRPATPDPTLDPDPAELPRTAAQANAQGRGAGATPGRVA